MLTLQLLYLLHVALLLIAGVFCVIQSSIFSVRVDE